MYVMDTKGGAKGSISEWPESEVFFEALPYSVESAGLENEKHDDGQTKDRVFKSGQLLAERGSNPAEFIGHHAGEHRQEGVMKSGPGVDCIPATEPRPPTMIIARYWIDTSSVKRSQEIISV